MPEFAAELEAILAEANEPDLAGQIASLEIASRCGCGDAFCQSFYTGDRPSGSWGGKGDHRTYALEPENGMVILDIVGGRIRFVEVLYRDDVGRALSEIPWGRQDGRDHRGRG